MIKNEEKNEERRAKRRVKNGEKALCNTSYIRNWYAMLAPKSFNFAGSMSSIRQWLACKVNGSEDML